MLTDPTADMLTRLRNAVRAGKEQVRVPHSKLKEQIAHLLQQEGYIQSYEVDRSGRHPALRITLRYKEDGEPALHHIERVSKPGRRVYYGVKELRPVHRGLGTAIVSTSKGILPDRECRKRRIGGEVICIVW